MESMDTPKDNKFSHLSNEEIKKLNKYSSDINYIGIGSIFFAFAALTPFVSGGESTYKEMVVGGVAFLYAIISTYGCFARPSWGALTGFLTAFLMLLLFPIGTIFGALGLRALSNGQLLFGDGRITNNELGEAVVEIEKQNA